MQKLTISSLSELRFTSPDSMMNREGDEVTVSKKTLKILMNSLGMVGDKFSKDLYDIDEAMWSDLVQKKCASSPFYTDNSAIIAQGEVINVVSNSNREWLLNLENLVQQREKLEGIDVQTLREADGFSVLCQKDGAGYVISVQIPSKHVTVKSVRINGGLVLVSPSAMADFKIDSGVDATDLSSILDHDVLMTGATEDEFYDYTAYLEQTLMSYQDSLDALKSVFGVRVKPDIPNPEGYTEKIDLESFSMPELDFCNLLLRKIYWNAYQFIPNPNWLERHLKFIDVPHLDYLRCLSSRYLSGNLDFLALSAYSMNAAGQNLDHTVVGRVFPGEKQK